MAAKGASQMWEPQEELTCATQRLKFQGVKNIRDSVV